MPKGPASRGHAALKAAGVPARYLDGLTTNIIQAVFPDHKFGKQK